MELVEEKPPSSALGFLTDNAIASTIYDAYSSLQTRRKALGLDNPGTVDGINREVQREVLLSNYMFSGLRCDLQKMFSISPLFRMQHGFAIGSPALPSWQMIAIYGTSSVFLQGAYSSDRSLGAWANVRWSPKFTSKTQTQISPGQGPTMVTFDNEYIGDDFTASLKAVGPSLLEGGLTGILVGSYLQSITPRLAVGFEGMWQRAAMNSRPETVMSYAARYKGTDWIASAQYLAQGSMGFSYWRKLTERVETGVDCQLQFAPGMGNGMFGGIRKEGTTTAGVKYNFTNSVYRAQIDSAGKLGMVLETRVAPPVMLTFAAEIDQVKQTQKLGVALSLENVSEEVQAAANSAEQSGGIVSPPY